MTRQRRERRDGRCEGGRRCGAGFRSGLREKYQAERDKRVRADGKAQYIEVEGRFRHFVDDHYVAPGFTRAPLAYDVDLVIIGGGFGIPAPTEVV